MSTINTKTMFDAIKQSLSSTDKEGNNNNSLYKEVLKFNTGNTYLVRLLPNVSSPKETIFHYYNHAWTSNSTGKFVTALCPTTFGESCPIDAYYLKTYRTGTETEKSSSSVLSRKEGWLVNVYVVSDPVNPENDGTVKILRYGKELDKIIQSALTGDDASDFGVEKIFDVVNGCTLRIKCESRTGDRKGSKQYVTYASSKFLAPSSLEINEKQLESIYSSVHDLKSLNKRTTPAEMQRMLDEHFFNLTTGSSNDNDDNDSDTDTETREFKPTSVKQNGNTMTRNYESSSENSSKDDSSEETDEALKKLLADL
jgi:hypothetical protein